LFCLCLGPQCSCPAHSKHAPRSIDLIHSRTQRLPIIHFNTSQFKNYIAGFEMASTAAWF
jgi:hypothetical protein